MMQQHSPAPQFGNWEEGENVHYSAYFERVGKSRSHTTPCTDSSEKNSDAYERSKLSGRASSPKIGSGMHELEAVAARHDRTDSPTYRVSKGKTSPAGFPRSYGGAGMRRSKAEVQNKMQHQNVGRLNHEHLANHEDGRMKSTNSSNRSPWQSAGTEYTSESRSHPSYDQASPSWARKGLSESSSHGVVPTNPGRSRLGSVARGDKTPDHEKMVPRFGDWNEKDPSSGDGYTQIFNRVRDEKQHGAATSPAIKKEQDYSSTQVQKAHDYKKPQKCGCFPWQRKIM